MSKYPTLLAVFVCMCAEVLLTTACSGRKTYRIAVSQCSQDIWREKLNEELRMGALLYDNVELSLASANDQDQRQIDQIDRFIKQRVDLLIVAPNQMATVSPAIDRAYDEGIPVIVFDRKTSSNKFTAYIGADNYEMGKQMGRFIAAQLHGKGHVLEVMGLKGSSPAIERHRGFVDALKDFPDMYLLASLQGDWTEESAISAVSDYKDKTQHIDFVFGQNDRMAMGARKVLSQYDENIRYCGIDGLPGQGGGISCVRDSFLTASYIYPTRGDLVMQLAMDILTGQQYKRENLIKAAIVVRENAEVMQVMAEEMNSQHGQLERLHNRIDWYFTQYRHQQVYTLLLVIIVVLVLGISWYVVKELNRRHRLEQEAFALVVSQQMSEPQHAVVDNAEKEEARNNGKSSTVISENEIVNDEVQTNKEALAVNRTETTTAADMDDVQGSQFLERLRNRVQEQMCDTDFSVETLAADMGMSRVQLYRRVKQLTGRTPVDIIRLSRLNRAKVLLASTDKNISEVAYAVGFSAPSYFTKCYKDEFGISPSEQQNNQ